MVKLSHKRVLGIIGFLILFSQSLFVRLKLSLVIVKRKVSLKKKRIIPVLLLPRPALVISRLSLLEHLCKKSLQTIFCREKVTENFKQFEKTFKVEIVKNKKDFYKMGLKRLMKMDFFFFN